jgi:hypothetical protein
MLIEMTEMVYTGVVDDLNGLIAGCKFPEKALFLAERLPKHVVEKIEEERQELLCFTFFDPNIPFAGYTCGRIFHRDFELRWEQIDDKAVRVVYVGVERSIEPLQVKRDLKLKRNSDIKYYYLFGKRLEPEELELIGKPATREDFAEVRIPRLLRYPAPENAKRVCIGVCEYVQETTGKVELFRFQSLEAAG